VVLTTDRAEITAAGGNGFLALGTETDTARGQFRAWTGDHSGSEATTIDVSPGEAISFGASFDEILKPTDLALRIDGEPGRIRVYEDGDLIGDTEGSATVTPERHHETAVVRTNEGGLTGEGIEVLATSREGGFGHTRLKHWSGDVANGAVSLDPGAEASVEATFGSYWRGDHVKTGVNPSITPTSGIELEPVSREFGRTTLEKRGGFRMWTGTAHHWHEMNIGAMTLHVDDHSGNVTGTFSASQRTSHGGPDWTWSVSGRVTGSVVDVVGGTREMELALHFDEVTPGPFTNGDPPVRPERVVLDTRL
jgi:hypothetical protein